MCILAPLNSRKFEKSFLITKTLTEDAVAVLCGKRYHRGSPTNFSSHHGVGSPLGKGEVKKEGVLGWQLTWQ